MRVTYKGGIRGLYLLRAELEAEGLTVEHAPPMEERNAGEVAVVVVLYVADKAAGDTVSAAMRAGASRAIAKLKERFPRDEAEIEDDE